jgi:hypothetical protein
LWSGFLRVDEEGSPTEVEALALAWHREIQRASGIVKFEGESSPDGA